MIQVAQPEFKKESVPTVSVIMPAYNSSATLGESIQSVVSQTFGDWELLVIDDCSQENLYSIVESFNDFRIHFIRLSRNSGVAVARNRGIQEAKGRYIAFLDSDDLWHPEKLEKQLHFMEKNGYAFTYTWYQQFDHDTNHLGNIVRTKPVVDYRELLKGNDIGCLTVMLDRFQIKEIAMPLQRHEDYITWLNILKQGWTAYSLPLVLAEYRKGKGTLTSNKWRSFLWTWKVYRDSQHLSLIQSGFCMAFYICNGLVKHYVNRKI